ncbi:MAG: hypothetical protein PWQ88_444 [Candidatus Methanomethylophilaceae archaeon]|nr:hypothetical protein [Candidatus Methanomethylophilaceae archaeon]MDI3541173.1 hypothetical protein [Candidatus Methanomethylophilaceae archaeon]HIJ00179.1 hypothetical protein [Candidatus Methanomethylophilaceae archaeon]
MSGVSWDALFLCAQIHRNLSRRFLDHEIVIIAEDDAAAALLDWYHEKLSGMTSVS